MKTKILNVTQVLVFLCIGIALLWFVFHKQNIHYIINELYKVNYFWIALSIIIGLISHVFRAMRWNLLFEPMGYKAKTLPTTYAVLIGYFANLAVPRMGEITRCGVLSKKNNIPIDKVIGTVFIERAFDMVCLIVIMLLTIVFQIPLLGGFVKKYVYTGTVNLIDKYLFIISIVVVLSIIIVYVLVRYLTPVFKKHPLYTKLLTLYHGFIDGLKSIMHLKSAKWFLIHTFCIWFCYTLMVYTCLLAMPSTMHLGFIDAITIMAIGSIGIVIPVPGGIGTYHYIVSLILTELYLINGANALAFATISHSSQTLLVILGGSISLLLIFLTKKK